MTRTTPLLDTPHPSRQQIFDAVVGHAASMTEKSQIPVEDSEVGYCVYRTPTGNACFIGGLLTDDEAAAMSHTGGLTGGTGIANLLDHGGDTVPERLRHQDLRRLLVRLQGIHDAPFGREDWPGLLRRAGESFSLDTGIVDRAFPITGA